MAVSQFLKRPWSTGANCEGCHIPNRVLGPRGFVASWLFTFLFLTAAHQSRYWNYWLSARSALPSGSLITRLGHSLCRFHSSPIISKLSAGSLTNDPTPSFYACAGGRPQFQRSAVSTTSYHGIQPLKIHYSDEKQSYSLKGDNARTNIRLTQAIQGYLSNIWLWIDMAGTRRLRNYLLLSTIKLPSTAKHLDEHADKKVWFQADLRLL